MTTNNVLDTPFPWGIAQGGTGSTGCKNILQQQTGTITFATSTTTIPFDNTKPPKTEGTEIGTVTITPISASSVLEVYATCSANCLGVAQVYTLALFQDSGSDALMATFSLGGVANYGFTLFLLARINSTSTSATTCKIRAGGNNAGTVTINGYNGGGLYNGTLDSLIIVTEVEV